MNNEILAQLKEEDKKYLEEVRDEILKNPDTLSLVHDFVISRVGQENNFDFDNLSLEEKIQTYLNHLAISLVSGDLKKKDIEDLLK